MVKSQKNQVTYKSTIMGILEREKSYRISRRTLRKRILQNSKFNKGLINFHLAKTLKFLQSQKFILQKNGNISLMKNPIKQIKKTHEKNKIQAKGAETPINTRKLNNTAIRTSRNSRAIIRRSLRLLQLKF